MVHHEGKEVIWFVLHKTDGSIVQHGNATSEEEAEEQADLLGLSILPVESQLGDVRDWYVSAGVLTPKQEIDAQGEYTIAADGVAEVSFPVPEGTPIIFQKAWHLSDGTFEFATDTPGDYVVKIEHGATTLSKKVIIHAV
ncbi:hypothetical protein U8P73_36650 (plasmid) [Rhizobium beringeri]|uniref:hypothetical protein n=1 Tax=Rhizobium beringeri TaxID=3019934 RepID=UPI002DDD9CEF|nr:hypothetical protein [Rhizobium beringeri]WSG93503.1 hypothetical protein U8P73_36650 [Rhizobium beringeri]